MKIEPRLSIAQVADLWGCSDQHVRNLVHSERLTCIRVGKLIRFRPEDLRDYEDRSRLGKDSTGLSNGPADGTELSGEAREQFAGYHAALRTRKKRDQQ